MPHPVIDDYEVATLPPPADGYPRLSRDAALAQVWAAAFGATYAREFATAYTASDATPAYVRRSEAEEAVDLEHVRYVADAAVAAIGRVTR